MSTELLLITGIGLLVVVLLVVIASLVVILRKNASASGLESSAILQERLSAREHELGNMRGQSEELESKLSAAQQQNSSLKEQVGRQETLLEQERKQHADKLQILNNAREQMSLEFKNLANEILEQKGKAFTDTNKQNLQHILQPLNEKIRQFEKKVEETYDREAKERFSLTKEIRNLQELNARISEDAVNLTRALKGESKTQGTWGEVILERVLERSGLKKGSEYEVQASHTSEEGKRQQPDVVVHLPEGKDVIIDAKVSLTAYEGFSSEEDEDRKVELLKQHLQSIRTHIKTLSAKDYHRLEGIQSLDFVMMFLPVEAAFTLAIQEDNTLFTEAFEKNIVLVGPSTLLATLRTIQNIWRYEHQNRNALEIADRAGRLYDKFVGFTKELEEIGQRIGQSQDAYDRAQKQLSSGRGNLVGQVEKLKTLGARASKQLPDKLLGDNDNNEGEQLPEEEDDD